MSEKQITLFGQAFSVTRVRDRRLGDGIEIDMTSSGDSPVDASYETLRTISEMFGTTKVNLGEFIHTDGYCDTCDYGSRRGYEVRVFGITRNHPFEEADDD